MRDGLDMATRKATPPPYEWPTRCTGSWQASMTDRIRSASSASVKCRCPCQANPPRSRQ